MGFFTLTGTLAAFAPHVPIGTQVVVEAAHLAATDVYAPISQGRVGGSGSLAAVDGTSPFVVTVSDPPAAAYVLSTLPTLFKAVAFVAPDAGTTTALSDLILLDEVPSTDASPITVVSGTRYLVAVDGVYPPRPDPSDVPCTFVGATDPTEFMVIGDSWLDTSEFSAVTIDGGTAANPVHIVRIRHDDTAGWAAEDPILSLGEEGIDTDTGTRKVGDGVTAWSSLLASGGAVDLVPTYTTVTAFTNSWVDQALVGYPPVSYTKDAMGFVHLRGYLISGTINQSALNLPTGFRPQFKVGTSGFEVQPDGNVQMTTAGTSTDLSQLSPYPAYKV